MLGSEAAESPQASTRGGLTRRAANLVTTSVPSIVAAVVTVTSGSRRWTRAMESAAITVEPGT